MDHLGLRVHCHWASSPSAMRSWAAELETSLFLSLLAKSPPHHWRVDQWSRSYEFDQWFFDGFEGLEKGRRREEVDWWCEEISSHVIPNIGLYVYSIIQQNNNTEKKFFDILNWGALWRSRNEFWYLELVEREMCEIVYADFLFFWCNNAWKVREEIKRKSKDGTPFYLRCL